VVLFRRDNLLPAAEQCHLKEEKFLKDQAAPAFFGLIHRFGEMRCRKRLSPAVKPALPQEIRGQNLGKRLRLVFKGGENHGAQYTL